MSDHLRLQEPLDQVLARYATINALIEDALARIAAGDRDQALLLSAGVVAKLRVLDGKLGLVDLRDAGGQARPPGIFEPSSSPAPRRHRRRRAA